MANLADAQFRSRDLMGVATLTIRIADPAHHRIMRALAFRCFRLGAWLLGIGRVEMVDMSDDVSGEDWS